MSSIPSREEALLADALAQPATQRAAFLAKACGADVSLLARLAALVAAHDRTESILAGAPALGATPHEEQAGDMIGRYKLLQKIGEGGCGLVWMAEQEEPVRRRVALKVIKLGMDTKAVVARFEAERQALAMMEHPNIAKVHDAGSTQTGRPFFVMELVRGIPITSYCDENHLAPNERLELFIKVCHAVQHAHQKGIIHRDLKPSNILVTVDNGAATPKIIDFGIAKATQGRLTEATVFTAFEQFIGTPVYMSPEQAEMSSLDVDTRTDIYSLGILLYELLTGRPPFDAKAFARAGVDEIRQHIRGDEPPKPSTRWRTLGQVERDTIARQRGTAPAQISVLLRGDLDWIVMRCIEKDRTRRYDTANGLAMDIQRHLRHEPVVARPPSTGYLLGKLIRRHRVGFAAATLVVLALLLGVTGTTIGLVRAHRAEAGARSDAETARQVSSFLIGLFNVSDPGEARGNSITAREILDRGAEQIQRSLAGQPATQATLMDTMGRVYQSLGLYDRAGPLLERALIQRRQVLGENDVETASSMNNLGALRRDKGEYPAAEQLLRDALAVRRRLLGERHPAVAATLNNLGAVLYMKGDRVGAEQLFREALALRRAALGSEHLDTSESLNDLAMALNAGELHDEAAPLYHEALAIRRRLLGNDNPAVAQSLNNLAMHHYRKGEHALAEPLFREALDMYRRMFGERHPEVSSALNNLALVLQERGALDEAEALFRQALDIERELLGPEHPQYANALKNLAGALMRNGKFAGAEPVFREALRVQRKAFPEGHWLIATTESHLGACLVGSGRYEAAESMLLPARAIIERQFGVQHGRTRVATERIVALYESWGRPEQAAEWRAKLQPPAPAAVPLAPRGDGRK